MFLFAAVTKRCASAPLMTFIIVQEADAMAGNMYVIVAVMASIAARSAWARLAVIDLR